MFKKIRYWFRNIFVFSKTETNASILMILIMIIMFIVPPVLKKINFSSLDESDTDHEILDSMIAEWDENKKSAKSIPQTPASVIYVPFDPNVVPKETLISFDISEKVADRIINYRSKGGKFHVKADLLKIYGFPKQKYQELFSYIILPEKKAAPSKVAPKEKGKDKYIRYEKNVPAEFDINTADTNKLKAIKGIGSVLSKRILKYRNSLGGFISKDQLQEVYGLDEQVLLQLKTRTIISSDFEPHKIDINNADVKQLSSHPYISRNLAERIVSYRDHHGKFDQERKLNDIRELDEQIKEQIYPYLKY